MTLPRAVCLLLLLGAATAKWVEGHVDTKDNWAFLARFCFLSLEGQFEYLIEYDREMGMPNLLLYYDDDSQWPAVYHSSKTCKERESVLNKAGQNQIIKLSHWYPDTEYSGCIVTKENKEMPAEKSSSTTPKPPARTSKPKNITSEPRNTSFYDQFLKPTTATKTTISDSNSTNYDGWVEVVPTDEFSTTLGPEDEWESIGPEFNETKLERLNDVEIMFDNDGKSNHIRKRSTFELLERYRRRRLNAESGQSGAPKQGPERLIVSCHNSRRFRSARERWWFIAISNCDSPKSPECRTFELLERYRRRRLNAESGQSGAPKQGPERLIVSCHNSRRFRSARERWWFIAISNCDSPKSPDCRTFELLECYRRRRLNAESGQSGAPKQGPERLIVSCHNSRRFRSARERWWFIAISNCDSPKGLDVKYKFLMTNGPDGDFWHEHFSADEFYVLPVLLAYTFAYVLITIGVVMCSVELKSRHLLHSTYKLFLMSVAAQQAGVVIQSLAYIRYATNGFGGEGAKVTGQFLCGLSETTFLLLLILMAKGYTITRGRLKVGFTVRLTVFMCCYFATFIGLFVYQAKGFDPGQVLYLYESPAGYGLVALRVAASCLFGYSTFFTARKFPEKNHFYCPFFICGTLWFYAGPLFILTANAYIDKWVRESVVTAVLLFITFNGHIMFLLLTLPVFANKNFPYHVRTTQIGVMEVTGGSGLDSFGHNAYHPGNGTAQTVIIPLTRRTEELIGNMYSQYMASAPPLDTPTLNGVKRINSLSPKNQIVHQDSTDTNASDDIKPVLTNEIFTVENQMSKLELPEQNKVKVLPHDTDGLKAVLPHESSSLPVERKELPSVLRSRRNILEPLKRDDVPSWSLAKGPCVVAMQRKVNGDVKEDIPEPPTVNGKKVPPVRNGLHQSSGEISTIHEGREQSYNRTVDLFTAGNTG